VIQVGTEREAHFTALFTQGFHHRRRLAGEDIRVLAPRNAHTGRSFSSFPSSVSPHSVIGAIGAGRSWQLMAMRRLRPGSTPGQVHRITVRADVRQNLIQQRFQLRGVPSSFSSGSCREMAMRAADLLQVRRKAVSPNDLYGVPFFRTLVETQDSGPSRISHHRDLPLLGKPGQSLGMIGPVNTGALKAQSRRPDSDQAWAYYNGPRSERRGPVWRLLGGTGRSASSRRTVPGVPWMEKGDANGKCLERDIALAA